MQGIVGGKEKIFCIPTRLGITEDQYVEILSVAAGSLAGMEQEDAMHAPTVLLYGLRTTFPCDTKD